MNIIREDPSFHSILQLRENLIDLNIGEHTFVDGPTSLVYAIGDKEGLHIPKTIYTKLNQLVQQNSFLEIGHLPMEDLWYALLGDQIAWSNQPIEIEEPKTGTKFEFIPKPSKKKEKKKKSPAPKKEYKIKEEPKRFNRYTALIEKSNEVSSDQPLKRKIQWKD